jgi:CelD/BcsL family acetyltransferase involved in cellulose biosynthesis
MTSALRFRLTRTDAEFAALEPAWRQLEACARPALPSLDYDWVRLAWGAARVAGREPVIASVEAEGRLALALPLLRRTPRRGRVRYTLLHGTLLQTTDVLLAHNTDGAAAIAKLFAGLRRRGKGASLVLANVADGTPLHAGAAASAEATEASALVDMPDGFDAYFSTHSPAMRSQHRRMKRRLGGTTLRLARAATWDDDLRWFLDTKRAWTPPDGSKLRDWVTSPAAEADLRTLGRLWADDGRAVLAILEEGGQRLAGCLCFRRGETAVLYAVGYRAEHARYSAGRTAIIETLAALAASGVGRVDMMPFPAEWKDRLKTGTQEMATLRIDLRADYSPDGSPWITVPVAATGVMGDGSGGTGATPSSPLRPAMMRRRSSSLAAVWRRMLRSMMKLE